MERCYGKDKGRSLGAAFQEEAPNRPRLLRLRDVAVITSGRVQGDERKHLTLRTRLKRFARKTLCFSRSRVMHDLLIGLYMNRVEFGRAI